MARPKKDIGPIVESLAAARYWYGQLETDGQRAVYGALLTFLAVDGRFTPTAPQLTELVPYHEQSVLRIMSQLRKLGAVEEVNRRPNLTKQDIPRGASIPIYVIPPEPSGVALGFPTRTETGSHPNRNVVPPEPSGVTRWKLEVGVDEKEIEIHDCAREGHEWVHLGRSVARCRHCKEKA